MNSFYSEEELNEIGFKSIGKNVLVSKKASIYSPHKISIGDNVRIDDFCTLTGNITLGSYIHISSYSALYGGNEGITMHDYSGVSSRVVVYAVNDDYSGEYMTNPMVPEKYKEVVHKPVTIGKHVIVGSGSIVLPGVVLKEGSSFGAMSLISRSADEWSVYAGIPARKIKERKKGVLLLEKQLIADLNE